MKQRLFLFGVLGLVGSTMCLAAVVASWWLAERVFFDRFFYYKSIAHGYFVPDQTVQLSQFGQRSLGIRLLKAEVAGRCDMTPRLVLIGDSYLWGMGVRNTETVTAQLHKLVPEIEVVSYAYPGATLADYLGFYQFAQTVSPNNYYIFLAVDNDILADSTTGFGQSTAQTALQHCITKYPAQSPQVTPDWQQLEHVEAARLTNVATTESWRSPLNACIAQELLAHLKGMNGGFIMSDPYRDTEGHYQKYEALLQTVGISVWSSQPLVTQRQLSLSELQVSRAEIHPSRTAHQLYAWIIFQEIKKTHWWELVTSITASSNLL